MNWKIEMLRDALAIFITIILMRVGISFFSNGNIDEARYAGCVFIAILIRAGLFFYEHRGDKK